MTTISDNLVPATVAAERLGVTRARISHYVRDGRLVPDSTILERCGRLMFSLSQLSHFRRRPVGWTKGRRRKKIPA